MWMDVLATATVEVSSESDDELFPITAALGHALTNGWRAATTGPQTVRLLFQEPQQIRRIRVHAVDRVSERTQQLRVFAGRSPETLAEVARWEFAFSPRGSTEEMEELAVALDSITVVELRIDPDAPHAGATEQVYASLRSFWLAGVS